METNNNQFTRFGQWLNESLSVKLGVIFFLTLILLIPAALVNDLVRERQQRQQEVIIEVSDSWSGPQVLAGPLMMLPYSKMVISQRGGVEQVEEQTHYIYLLPEELEIKGTTDTKELSRGIFDVAVYEADVKVSGYFGPLDLTKDEISFEQVHWDKARMVVGVGDLRGVKTISPFRVGGQDYTLDEYAKERPFDNNLIFSPELNDRNWDKLPFEFSLDLRGTANLGFLQLAKQTRVSVNGNWSSPKFVGQFLPEQRETGADHFQVNWALAHFARALPQQWTAQEMHELDGFGIEFLQPVNHYQKSERATKYAILVISLSFLALFFTEILAKSRIHIVQYVLIGAAMIVFYALLLAFSEHIGFNAAYGVAAFATIGLITGFVAKTLKQKRIAVIFCSLLTLFYLFVFVIIQLNDLALLMGSIALFFCVAALMYFSSRINWQGK
ncbi:MAG TPA: cell envelope integrity protein CreD [Sphingobacteriaceae bacterium]|nr:cell envelope integrity protein CreD [Sphingobacteriaceae bacterium]